MKVEGSLFQTIFNREQKAEGGSPLAKLTIAKHWRSPVVAMASSSRGSSRKKEVRFQIGSDIIRPGQNDEPPPLPPKPKEYRSAPVSPPLPPKPEKYRSAPVRPKSGIERK